MGILELAAKRVAGKKAQTLITFLITLILFLFAMTGLLLESAVVESRYDTLRQIGARISIFPKYIKTPHTGRQAIRQLIYA
jgi:hypothetical protein